MELPQLRDFIVAHFNDNELRDLCFNLGVDYESLPGEGKAAKARELVAYCQRHDDLLAKLEAACLHLRPDVSNTPIPADHLSAPQPPLENSAESPAPTTPPTVQFSSKEIGCSGPWGRVVIWWNSHSSNTKAAYITGVFALLAAVFMCVGQPIITEWVNRPTATFAPTVTLTPLPTETPTKTPTPTLTPTPFATVEAFSIIKNGTPIDVVRPNGTTNVALGERIIVRAEVSTNTAPTDLLFTWSTCKRDREIAIHGYGVSEMLYEAPRATLSDCIKVTIEKGGAPLGDGSIFVEVK